VGWVFVAWMTLDISYPFVRAMMPLDTVWSPETALAVFVMRAREVGKRRIVAKSSAPGVPVSAVAKRHAISANLPFD